MQEINARFMLHLAANAPVGCVGVDPGATQDYGRLVSLVEANEAYTPADTLDARDANTRHNPFVATPVDDDRGHGSATHNSEDTDSEYEDNRGEVLAPRGEYSPHVSISPLRDGGGTHAWATEAHTPRRVEHNNDWDDAMRQVVRAASASSAEPDAPTGSAADTSAPTTYSDVIADVIGDVISHAELTAAVCDAGMGDVALVNDDTDYFARVGAHHLSVPVDVAAVNDEDALDAPSGGVSVDAAHHPAGDGIDDDATPTNGGVHSPVDERNRDAPCDATVYSCPSSPLVNGEDSESDDDGAGDDFVFDTTQWGSSPGSPVRLRSDHSSGCHDDPLFLKDTPTPVLAAFGESRDGRLGRDVDMVETGGAAPTHSAWPPGFLSDAALADEQAQHRATPPPRATLAPETSSPSSIEEALACEENARQALRARVSGGSSGDNEEPSEGSEEGSPARVTSNRTGGPAIEGAAFSTPADVKKSPARTDEVSATSQRFLRFLHVCMRPGRTYIDDLTRIHRYLK